MANPSKGVIEKEKGSADEGLWKGWRKGQVEEEWRRGEERKRKERLTDGKGEREERGGGKG